MSDKPMNKSRRDAVKMMLGGFAAIVSGSIERDGDEELTIIKWPDRIPPFSELRAQRFSGLGRGFAQRFVS